VPTVGEPRFEVRTLGFNPTAERDSRTRSLGEPAHIVSSCVVGVAVQEHGLKQGEFEAVGVSEAPDDFPGIRFSSCELGRIGLK
jgi:hypothetical protein